ncbi:MAG TPA: phasin family protein [Xanthobacteraceae bacterium]|nr:phasin family protein [Xanthobacteraceae bacterium]
MAKSPMGSFEIPVEMRNVAEQSVVQARQAFDGFMSAAQKALSKWEEQTAVAQAGARDTGERIMGFAEQNVATSFEFAQRLVRAKDVDEMMRLQAEFVRAQMEVLGEQAKELGQGATTAAREAASGRKSR